MAGRQEEERQKEHQEPLGAVGEEGVIDDPILKTATLCLRRYVIERIKREKPGLHVSSELLGGSPSELEDPKIKEVVEQLIEITDKLNRNAELQRLINQVPDNCSLDIFMKVARTVFADGINWAQVACLFHLAYELICQALIKNHPETIRAIIEGFRQVIREQPYYWLVQQGGWVGVITGCRQWRTVAIVASVALVAAIVYYRKTR
ncbi:apoptosis regulator BAX-like [Centropristis striata]|uniref:apoptosis regulator BAX-like n=1 Tax=Centropristis striata TaxID=184440 RepID=UPI0027E05209|nr:apoptosis regulator BAX-like [Centropristis striata]